MTDIVAIVAARYVACLLYPQDWNHGHTLMSLAAVVAFTITGEVNGVYRSWRGVPVRRQLYSVLWSWTLIAPILLVWLFVTKATEDQSRLINTWWFFGAAATMCLWRVAERGILSRVREKGENLRTVGIIGATPMGLRLMQELQNPTHGFRLRGVYDDRTSARVRKYLGGDDLAGSVEQAIEDARKGRLDFVYIALPLRAEFRISETLSLLADTTATVQLVTDFTVYQLLHARWSSLGDIPTVSVFDTPFSGVAGWTKRVEDILLGTFFLILLAPLMLLVAIAVKVSSKGPVFFLQKRYGLNGQAIRVVKFRTMTVAEDGDVVRQATRGDQRITKVGAFLRRTSLDELPQFWNVVRGEMSVVGPRPHAVAHNEAYRGQIHGYMLRHKVKPGVTGWAQVNGCRGETDTVEKMRARIAYDLEYIENWHLGWDLEIILRTALTVLKDRNAY